MADYAERFKPFTNLNDALNKAEELASNGVVWANSNGEFVVVTINIHDTYVINMYGKDNTKNVYKRWQARSQSLRYFCEVCL